LSDEGRWRKSTHSTGNGECVEAASSRGDIAVRDSKQPDGPKVRYSEPAWRSFLAATKLGNFDIQH
jgi:hypothetical protein